MTAERDLLDQLRRADPLDRAPDRDAAHLAAAHRLLIARRSATASSTPGRVWRRRFVTVAAAAVAVPVVATVLVPAVTDRDVPGALVGTAVASESGLSCGTGYAQPIRPDAADPRPWPQTLPSGWSVREVFARSSTSTGWCTTPSLVAAEVDDSGLVTGAVKIIGPARGIDLGSGPDPVPDRVGAYAAQRLLPYGGAPAPVDAPEDDRTAWVITDDDGQQWYASVDGYTTEQGRQLLAAVTLGGGSVAWDTAKAPDLTVLHRRTGPAYPLRTEGQDWYLRFDAPGGRERVLEAISGRVGDTAVARAGVGTRLTEIAGRPAVVYLTDGRPHAVVTDFAPGVTVFASDISDHDDEVLTMLASLVLLDADDPRLDDLALDEDMP